MDAATKKKLVVLDKNVLIARVRSNIAEANRDIVNMEASIVEKRDALRQWEAVIAKEEAELAQLNG